MPIIVPAEGAKVLIVDFSDFQCPYCRQAFVALKPILAKYNAQQPGSVRLVLKDYPARVGMQRQRAERRSAPGRLRGGCGRAPRESQEPGRRDGGVAVLQPAVDDARRACARRRGTSGRSPISQAKYASTLELVKSDIAFGKSLGVAATPTIFINGVKIAGVLAPQYFDQAIAIELQRAPK